MGRKKPSAECRLCGVKIVRVTTHTLLTHLMRYHPLADFVDKDSKCLKCDKKLIRTNRRWTFDLYEHIRQVHPLQDYFKLSDYSILELLEFMCDYCYRNNREHITCYMDRDAFEEGKAIPTCQVCGFKMILRRKKDKEYYGI